jgi:hypothetical protein
VNQVLSIKYMNQVCESTISAQEKILMVSSIKKTYFIKKNDLYHCIRVCDYKTKTIEDIFRHYEKCYYRYYNCRKCGIKLDSLIYDQNGKIDHVLSFNQMKHHISDHKNQCKGIGINYVSCYFCGEEILFDEERISSHLKRCSESEYCCICMEYYPTCENMQHMKSHKKN